MQENRSGSNTALTAGPLIFATVLTLLVGYLLVSNIQLSQRVTRLEQRSNRMRGQGWRGGGGRGMMRGPMGGPMAGATPGAPVVPRP